MYADVHIIKNNSKETKLWSILTFRSIILKSVHSLVHNRDMDFFYYYSSKL